MNAEELRQQNEEFIQKLKVSDPAYFEKLRIGQTPEFFVLSCSDSRVSPSVITQMPLGKMFVHRNIANLVDRHDESFSASLYYALRHLKVRKIFIQGHTDCGGVKAAWGEGEEVELQGWINKIRRMLPDRKQESKQLTLDDLTKINVINQVESLKNHPIYMKYGQGVEIVGWLFHVESGVLERVTALEEQDRLGKEC